MIEQDGIVRDGMGWNKIVIISQYIKMGCYEMVLYGMEWNK